MLEPRDDLQSVTLDGHLAQRCQRGQTLNLKVLTVAGWFIYEMMSL